MSSILALNASMLERYKYPIKGKNSRVSMRLFSSAKNAKRRSLYADKALLSNFLSAKFKNKVWLKLALGVLILESKPDNANNKKVKFDIDNGQTFFADEAGVIHNPLKVILDFRSITPRIDI